MLVTNVGGLGEIVLHQKTGYVTSTTPESIADAIIDFFEHHREAEFSKNTSIEKKRFQWNFMVDSITALYERIR